MNIIASTERRRTRAKYRPKLLLVHDELELCEALETALKAHGFEVSVAHNVAEAFASAGAEPPEYALIRLRRQGLSWLALIKELKTLNPNMRIELLTNALFDPRVFQAFELGARRSATDSTNVDEIVATIGNARYNS